MALHILKADAMNYEDTEELNETKDTCKIRREKFKNHKTVVCI